MMSPRRKRTDIRQPGNAPGEDKKDFRREGVFILKLALVDHQNMPGIVFRHNGNLHPGDNRLRSSGCLGCARINDIRKQEGKSQEKWEYAAHLIIIVNEGFILNRAFNVNKTQHTALTFWFPAV